MDETLDEWLERHMLSAKFGAVVDGPRLRDHLRERFPDDPRSDKELLERVHVVGLQHGVNVTSVHQ